MAPLAFFVLGLMFVIGALVSMAVAMGLMATSSRAIRRRLESMSRTGKEDNETVHVAGDSLGGVLSFVAPSSTRAKIERSVLLAGRPDGWTVRRVLALKLGATLLAGFLCFALMTKGFSVPVLFASVTVIAAAYLGPDIMIRSRGTARQASIQRELPDVLDQVTISIESGLGFEAAFARIGERRTGPLAEEIVRTVQDMRLGMSRRDAYEALAARTDVDDLRRFVKSIGQAEQFGISVSSVVRTQAQEIRLKRRARAEATALKVPVKILFPLLVCILPVLFIVVLTPAIINISRTLGKG